MANSGTLVQARRAALCVLCLLPETPTPCFEKEERPDGLFRVYFVMIAAQRFNEREDSVVDRLYGVVTIGELWRFMQLEGTTVRIDVRSYHIDRLPKIMGILLHLTRKNRQGEEETRRQGDQSG